MQDVIDTEDATEALDFEVNPEVRDHFVEEGGDGSDTALPEDIPESEYVPEDDDEEGEDGE